MVVFKHDIDDEVARLATEIRTSGAEAEGVIERRAEEAIGRFTTAVNAEKDRMKEEVKTCLLDSNHYLSSLFEKQNNILDKAKRNLKLGEQQLKSGSDSDIKKHISKLQEMSSEILETNPRCEIKTFKICLTDSKKKTSESFVVDLGEVVKPDVKSFIDSRTDRAEQTNSRTDRTEQSNSRTDRTKQTNSRTDRTKQTNSRTDRTKQTNSRTDRAEQTNSRTDRAEQTHSRADRRTDRLTLTQTFNTKISSDERDSCLFSIAVLGERGEKIVVCDCYNSRVKCFSTRTSALLGQYETPSPPLGLAKSRDQQVVVALPWERQILYLDIQGDIRRTNTLTTGKEYRFISVLPGNRLAVSVWYGCVDILDEGGHVIQTLPTDSIPDTTFLTVKGESLLVVTDSSTRLTCVTSSGHVTWRSHDSARLNDLCGVACDMEEFVYVCNWNTNCIVQLSRDGQVIRDVITAHDGLSEPRSVCCDDDKLYVCQFNGDVKIFTWGRSRTVKLSPRALCKTRKFKMTNKLK